MTMCHHYVPQNLLQMSRVSIHTDFRYDMHRVLFPLASGANYSPPVGRRHSTGILKLQLFSRLREGISRLQRSPLRKLVLSRTEPNRTERCQKRLDSHVAEIISSAKLPSRTSNINNFPSWLSPQYGIPSSAALPWHVNQAPLLRLITQVLYLITYYLDT
jgi:hypothetical protein